MNARRTAVRLTFAGVDISTDINKHLLSLTYTDNEEDKTDDLQLSLDDREGVWLGNWLNTPGASKGVEISAVIVQKNWESNGKDRVLDCGVFEIDTVDGSGPPAKATIKAGSIPYKSTVRTQKKTKAWENYTLSSIAKEIAGKNGLTCMFESAFDPLYTRKEQIQESDITFLQRLCKAAGISLKVTAKIIVLFDAAAYEQKDAVRVIKRGTADVSSWSFSTSLHDASYSKCHVSYTDPTTGKTIEYTYTPRNADKDGQVLEVNEKVSNREEARQLAMKRLRQKNKGEFKASFKLTGDARLVAGITVQVSGYGAFDGKYIIETATHSVSKSGYKTDLTLEFVSGCVLNLWLGLGVWDYSNQPGNVLGQICPAFGLLWFFIMPLAIWAEDTTRYLIWAYDCAVYHSQEAPPTIAPYSLKSVYGDFICGR